MERLSKGKLLKRMEDEYGSMLGPSANSSVTNSASTSKRHDLPDSSSFPLRLHSQSQACFGFSCSSTSPDTLFDLVAHLSCAKNGFAGGEVRRAKNMLRSL